MSCWKLKEVKKLIQKTVFFCLPFSDMRSRFIKRHHIFLKCGENLFYQPRKIPMDPKLIKIHNNVVVSADVRFITHDVIHLLMRNIDPDLSVQHLGCIEIFDNCFIGAGAQILGGVSIGPNAIVAAGAVVTKDVLPGTIVAGIPARKAGTFENLKAKRRAECEKIKAARTENRTEYEWRKFDRKHKQER